MRVFDTEVYEVDESTTRIFRTFSGMVCFSGGFLFFVAMLQLIFFLGEHVERMSDKGIQAFSILFLCFVTKSLFGFCHRKLCGYFENKLESLP